MTSGRVLSTSIVVLDGASPAAQARRRLARFPAARWALVRWLGRWYVLRAAAAGHRLGAESGDHPIGLVLDLASDPPVDAFDLARHAADPPPGVALIGSEPVGFVADVHAMAVPVAPDTPRRRGLRESGGPPEDDGVFAADAAIDAPARVQLAEVFDLTVGVGAPGEHGDIVVTGLAPDVTSLELHLHVLGPFEVVARPDGPLVVDRHTLAHQPSRFRLRAAVPPYGADPITGVGVERVEIRFVHEGVPVGRVWREIEVAPAGAPAAGAAAPNVGGPGISLSRQPQDVTVVIARPDGDPAAGRYVLTVASPHLGGPGRSWAMPLGDGESAQSLAARIRDLARDEAATPQTDDTFLGLGRFIADLLPDGLWEALAEVAAARGPQDRPLSALLVTDEAYVPWELAVMPSPLDPARPPFLGAQLSVGRWPHDEPLPSPHPLRNDAMAVVVGRYGLGSGWAELPGAEAEAAELVRAHGARLVPALRADLDDLLSGRSGPVDVLHFCGHGGPEADDGEAVELVLEDGELNEFALAAAPIAAERPVLLVFNACVAGFAHEAMGAYAGMAGAAARTGYRGYVAPLWEVGDDIAQEVGLGLYDRTGQGATMGEYLREVRSRFVESPNATADTTHLAYTFYGHPDLRIEAGVP